MRRHLRPREERQVRSRTAGRVRVEQMVRARIILIYAALHELHAEHATVEIEVLLRRSGNAGDVMKSADGIHSLAALVVVGASCATSYSGLATPISHLSNQPTMCCSRSTRCHG